MDKPLTSRPPVFKVGDIIRNKETGVEYEIFSVSLSDKDKRVFYNIEKVFEKDKEPINKGWGFVEFNKARIDFDLISTNPYYELKEKEENKALADKIKQIRDNLNDS